MPKLYGTLTPAYNRDYKSGPAALAAWNDGKDFVINNPQMKTYCSIRDTEDCEVGHTLQIRWAKMTQTGIITKQQDGTYAGNLEDETDEVE